MPSRPLRIAFVHPDLGIGGAERLVVDAALGLQMLGHTIDIYTSHHDPDHCFDETKDGRLYVHAIEPPFPRSVKGKFHILFAHLRGLHLTKHLLSPSAPRYDIYFVDQLSTYIPFLRTFARTRVVFYCHFPDKLLANGEYVDDPAKVKKVSLVKRIYRFPMDWLEEVTTGQSDIILANSRFTARVFKSQFPSIHVNPIVIHPGINVSAYSSAVDSDSDIMQVMSDRPTLLSLNRFEKKKNVGLAIASFAILRSKASKQENLQNMRLVIAGGYDPRVEENMMTLVSLIDSAKAASLTFNIVTPPVSRIAIPPFNTTITNPDILFILSFTTAQRSALLSAPSTLALLYTPANEHFGIIPVEGMLCGLPVLACDSGGPTESVVDSPSDARTGWLRKPDAEVWAEALSEVVGMEEGEREALGERARKRAREVFGMEAMAKRIEEVLEVAASMGRVGIFASWWYALILLSLLLAYFIRLKQ